MTNFRGNGYVGILQGAAHTGCRGQVFIQLLSGLGKPPNTAWKTEKPVVCLPSTAVREGKTLSSHYL